MRTNIDIDDDLMKAAMEITGLKTKKDTVEEALRILVQRRRAHEELMKLRGKLHWEGDLSDMRRNPHLPDEE
ncbi:type II toxin-antitoxin system VapB family antitoxin [Aureimonas leprariae]|uniref:Type II toxin-antitoxin system VapB family antitoxin n=1 Tax=Plantimonas leprariae TaxID=2615207 RepID=A0A7V7PQN7_9HYPH|nr:type II toxin-antitoxin system VapB family antitoxin [Aureimonas leprariae]KAB0680678.1 type II toxin-antitoxin system VapB family antitoxin [Aureimonas leprariae]